MIKINLATRKQSAAVMEGSSSKMGGAFEHWAKSLARTNLNLETVRLLPVRRMVLALSVAGIGWFIVGVMQDSKMRDLNIELELLEAERSTLQKKLAETSSYQKLKDSLEQDEKLIQTKLNVINELIAGREIPPKLLFMLSNAIPPQGWLTQLNINQNTAKFQGESIGFDAISDFMKNIGSSTYYTEVQLLKSAADANASFEAKRERATFEIEAKRRALAATPNPEKVQKSASGAAGT